MTGAGPAGRGVIVVIAPTADRGAQRVAAALDATGQLVRWVTPELLAGARSWEHRVAADGRTRTVVRLADGEALASDDVGAVLQRVPVIAAPPLPGASARDRAYAEAERQALLASWLAGFGDRVVHRPTGDALVPGPAGVHGWRALAAAAGVPVVPVALASARRWLPDDPARRVLGAGPAPLAPVLPAMAVRTGWHPAGSVLVVGDTERTDLADRALAERIAAVVRHAGLRLGRATLVTGHPGDGTVLLDTVDPFPDLDRAEATVVAGWLAGLAGGAR